MTEPKKKWSTLSIVLMVLGGGFLVVVLAVGIGVYLFVSSPTGKQMVGVMGEAVKISQKAQKAPGTRELRAMGCDQATVMDEGDLDRLFSHIDGGTRSRAFGEMVTCTVNPWGKTPPACDALAATYVGAVGPRSRPFLVSVQKGGSRPPCMTTYDRDGKLLGALVDEPPPPLPTE